MIFGKIERLYHAIRDGGPEERAALLEQRPELRREVESLLAERNGGEFLDRLAVRNANELQDTNVTIAAVGASLGPYRIENKLGQGGIFEAAMSTELHYFGVVE